MAIKISKLDAAKRQLDCAISLWFRGGDEVSIHALAFNAYQIVQDIHVHRGNRDFTMRGLAERHVKPEQVDAALKLMRRPMTFFKHADRDPDDVLSYNPEQAEATFAIILISLDMLGERRSDLQSAFALWQSIHQPELFIKPVNPTSDSSDVVLREQVRTLSKRDFLDAALSGYAISRARL